MNEEASQYVDVVATHHTNKLCAVFLQILIPKTDAYFCFSVAPFHRGELAGKDHDRARKTEERGDNYMPKAGKITRYSYKRILLSALVEAERTLNEYKRAERICRAELPKASCIEAFVANETDQESK